MTVGIVDYDAGNLKSVETCLTHLGFSYVLSGDPQVLEKTDRLVFPGDGHAATSMENLKKRGLDQLLSSYFRSGKPILGICVGSQIVLDKSEEGNAVCLGLIPGECRRLSGRALDGSVLKVPHMGWNTMKFEKSHPLLAGIPDQSSFYFVHSFYTLPANSFHVLGTTEYGERFATGLIKDNLAAFQFHPEKSGPVGLKLVDNFLRWKGV